MEAFLREGGQVQEVPRGVSGRESPTGPLRPERPPAPEEREPRPDRVYLNDVVAAIEARRRPQQPAKSGSRTRRPKKRLIYDDFGEPLRWEWVEE